MRLVLISKENRVSFNTFGLSLDLPWRGSIGNLPSWFRSVVHHETFSVVFTRVRIAADSAEVNKRL